MIFIPDQIDYETALPAADFNSLLHELQNVILDTIPAFDGLDERQVVKSIENYVVSGATFNDTGSANNYVLSSISSKAAPTEYFDGSIITFKAQNTNTAASTLNLNSLGTLNIYRDDGATITQPNDIKTNRYTTVIYDASLDFPSGAFRLLSSTEDSISAGDILEGYCDGYRHLTSPSDVNIIRIYPGTARDFANTLNLDIPNPSVGDYYEKLFDTVWAPISSNIGGPTGGMASAVVVQPNTTYHIFVVGDVDSMDLGFDDQIDASNLLVDTGFSSYKRIGSFYTDGASAPLGYFFTPETNKHQWLVPTQDINGITINVANFVSPLQLSAPQANTPGIDLWTTAEISIETSGTTVNQRIYVFPPGITEPVDCTLAPTVFSANSGAQIYIQCLNGVIRGAGSVGGSTTSVNVRTLGWIDYRTKY